MAPSAMPWALTYASYESSSEHAVTQVSSVGHLNPLPVSTVSLAVSYVRRGLGTATPTLDSTVP